MTISLKNIKRVKAIRNERICFDCAYPISAPDIFLCPRCGSSDIDERSSRPIRTKERDFILLPFPWQTIKFFSGGTVLLSGDKGSGKTTLCLTAQPTLFITTEQEPEAVSHAWWRIVGDQHQEASIPRIANCESWDQLEEDLRGITEKDLLVVDSISQLSSSYESPDVVKRCIEEIRRVGARALFIAQFTKDGHTLGPNEIAHMVDVVCQIPKDRSGMRRLILQKNRFGSLSSTYFSIDGTGIIPQPFSYGYTVEGPVGNYSLHMYPMSGAKYGGIMDDLVGQGFNLEGYASSGISCAAYSGGFAEPPDVSERQKFAEDHNLIWISAEEAAHMIQNPEQYLEKPA
tara:strand:- start:789 stop:1823 length:1035 start_codon:yes stop_codon:yes gene_type:complete